MDISSDAKQLVFNAINYSPHDGQVKAHNLIDYYRYVSLVCGRQFGKTRLAIGEAVYRALLPEDDFGPQLVYLVSDTLDHTDKLFKPLSTIFERPLKSRKHKIYRRDRVIELKSGAIIKAKTAQEPASLAGDSVSFAIVDESGYILDPPIDVLLPALSIRRAKMLSIGTPDRSDTWFKRFFELGLTEDAEAYASLQLPSAANPYMTEEELEFNRLYYGETNFRRMYLAEFVDLDENPLAHLLPNARIEKEELPPQEGHTYVAGVDLADRLDYTAVVIVDVTEKPYRVVKVERWQGTGYEVTGAKIAGLLKAYNNATGYVDRTGVGDAAIPHIRKHYGNIIPIVFTQAEKQSMFDTVATTLEKGDLTLLNNLHLMQEMRVLRAIQTKRGVSYQAPTGQHDDVVMGLFLAGKGFDRQIYIPRGQNLSGFRTPL